MRRFRACMQDSIKARVSIEEKQALLNAAKSQGVSLSDYIRNAATEAAQRVAA